jgi:hypothetical protein
VKKIRPSPARSWLLLLFSLPATHKTARVAMWRKLQKSGAIQIQTSTYLLPDTPPQYELFQWLAQQVKDYGGEPTLIRAQQIEGLSDAKIIGLFHAARDSDYATLSETVRKLDQRGRKKRDKTFAGELEKLKKTFRSIREIDFFDAPKAHAASSLLDRVENSERAKKAPVARLKVQQFRGRTWLTRPRPEIDRVGSAWLIRRFIDPNAAFVFASRLDSVPNALPFDFPGAEFSHHGEDCTFETLLTRFGIEDKALRKIAEMVHDADLEDEKFQRPECVGLDRILKGWAKRGMSDDELLAQGAACFDGLFAFLQRL